MNNPCKVIRQITKEFSEIQVFPKYVEEGLSGSGWCAACMLGDMDGAHPTHTCEEYQEVIDHINDTEASMIIVAENRLLQDNPVEFKVWEKLRSEVKSQQERNKQLREENRQLTQSIERRSILLVDINEEICNAEHQCRSISSTTRDLYNERVKLEAVISEMKNKVLVGGVKVSLTMKDVKEMIEAKVVLQHLEAEGVDNWEWYSESIPDNLTDLIRDEIEQISLVDY